jgi:hypothetical protein
MNESPDTINQKNKSTMPYWLYILGGVAVAALALYSMLTTTL